MSELRETLTLQLESGEVKLKYPARMSWEDRHRIKAIIDLIQDPVETEKPTA
ncbi:MAG: hypothetical protein ABIH23_18385 [bacterium]